MTLTSGVLAEKESSKTKLELSHCCCGWELRGVDVDDRWEELAAYHANP